MKTEFTMTSDGSTLKDIEPFIKKNIKQKGIIDFRLTENANIIETISTPTQLTK